MLKKLSLIFAATSVAFVFAGFASKPAQALECVTRTGNGRTSTLCQSETVVEPNGCKITRTAHPDGSVTSSTICSESTIQKKPDK